MLFDIELAKKITERVAERYPITLNMLAGNDEEAKALLGKLSGDRPDLSTEVTDEGVEVVEFNCETVLAIHGTMLGIFGGQDGYIDENLYKSCSISPFQAFGDMELYPGVFLKAAKYMFDFAHYQVFADGNKRTGFSTSVVFLEANGYEFVMPDSEAYKLIFDIATNKYTNPEEFVDILKSNVRLINP